MGTWDKTGNRKERTLGDNVFSYIRMVARSSWMTERPTTGGISLGKTLH